MFQNISNVFKIFKNVRKKNFKKIQKSQKIEIFQIFQKNLKHLKMLNCDTGNFKFHAPLIFSKFYSNQINRSCIGSDKYYVLSHMRYP